MENYILRNENAIYYEIKYSNDNAIFLQLGSERYLITDARYTEEALNSVSSCEVIESTDNIQTVIEKLKDLRIELLFDPYEWNVADFSRLKTNLRNIKFTEKPHLSKMKRIIKSKEEVLFIETAVKYGKDAFSIFKEYLTVKGIGKKEKELHYKLKTILQKKGALELSFDPIVAINENTSKPHALPTNRRLSNGDLVLIDAGVKYNRYCSDRTETFMFQKSRFSSVKMSNKVQQIYDIVKKAHDEVINKVRTGMRAKEVDKIARDIIENAGYGDKFIHSTGHGVGLDIHEFPNISQKSDIVIEDGMVFTVEPGIYIPDFLGIRIENVVVMENGRARVL